MLAWSCLLTILKWHSLCRWLFCASFLARGEATLFANTTPHGGTWAPWLTRKPMLYQGAHQGVHYRVTISFFFVVGWSTRFRFIIDKFRFEIGNVCVSSYLRIMIYVSLIRRSYCSYLSDWWKMEHQDLVVLHVDSDIAELRYLVCMAQSFELGLVTSFCNVFSLNSASLRYWICWISASVKRWHWNINMVNFSDRVIWLTKWSFHNVFNFSLSSVRWLAALRNLFKGGTKDWSQSNNVWLLYLTISLMELCMLCKNLPLLHMQSLSI